MGTGPRTPGGGLRTGLDPTTLERECKKGQIPRLSRRSGRVAELAGKNA